MLKNNDEMFNKGVIWVKNVIFYNDIIFGSVAKKGGESVLRTFPLVFANEPFSAYPH